MRLVDAENALQYRLIAHGGINRLDVVALVAAARYIYEVAFEFVEFGCFHQIWYDEIAVVDKGLYLGGGEWLGDLDCRAGIHFDCFHKSSRSV